MTDRRIDQLPPMGATAPDDLLPILDQTDKLTKAISLSALGVVGPTGPTGPQGPAGTNGTNGVDGRTILSGTINPTGGVGADGDYYINYSTSYIFGPKASGTWPGGVSIVGPAGAAGIDGRTILSGTATPPSNGLGANGDIYINTSTNFLYGPKAAGAWPAGVSLVGPTGPTGATGATGPTGPSGTASPVTYLDYTGQGSAPANPGASTFRTFFDTAGKAFVVNSAGLIVPLGGGLSPSYQAATFTAAPGNNYLCNNTSGSFTATLPTGAAFSTLRFSDDALVWDGVATRLTIAPASGQTIKGLAVNETLVCNVRGAWVQLDWDATNTYWVPSYPGYSATSGPTAAATATTDGIVTSGTQTLGGDKTFNGRIIPAGGIKGRVDGMPTASGDLGEVATVSPGVAVAVGSSGAWKTITSMVVQPGNYIAYANAYLSKNTMTSPGEMTANLSLSPNSSTDISIYSTAPTVNISAAPVIRDPSTRIAGAPLSFSVATTIYLNAAVSYSSAGSAVWRTESFITLVRT